MILSHVVACARNGVIGNEGQLPWHLPADLKRFKQLTMGHVMIMGRKTYESIGRPLPGRFTIVLSRHPMELPAGAALAQSWDEALEIAKDLTEQWGEEIFIVGGGEIYRQSLEKIARIYLTEIQANVEGDTVYPVEQLRHFQIQSKEDGAGPPDFTVACYERKLTP